MSRDTGFYVFQKGLQENGYVEAIKINKPWKASVSAFFIKNQNVIDLTFSTYFTEEVYPNNISEVMSIDFFYKDIENICFKLERNLPMDSSYLSARSRYYSTEGDIALDFYLVDEESNESYLEIEKIDLENGKISGRFMVTFLRRNANTRYTFNRPIVRFFNGYFEADLNIFTGSE